MAKYLDSTGLTYLWAKIKTWVGTYVGLSNGTITIGSNSITPLTDHQDISGKADKTATVSTVAYDTTNKKLTKTINGTSSDVVTAATIVTDGGGITSHQDISGKADKATTLSGYGITDAKIASGTITLGSNSITPLTSHQDISGKADKATTLAGYGITDAKIDGGVITLGSNTITPLTSHQDISGKVNTTAVGAANGVCPLNSSSKIDSTYLPSYVDDVIEAYARTGQTALTSAWLATGSASGTVITPETGKIYVLMADSGDYAANTQFRWGGSAYVKLADGGVSAITNSEIDSIVAN